jgi:predicted NBD/HSP70 family sugar kinase
MADSSHLRRINERKIVHMVLRLRRTSRIQLAEVADMSPATVGRIVDHLVEESILAEIPPDSAPLPGGIRTLGRPIQLLELDRKRLRFLLIQIGVRQTRIAVAPVAIPDADEWPVEFATPTSGESWLKSLQRNCKKLRMRHVEGVIMSCPGVIDERSGATLLSPNMRWAERVNFPAAIQSAIQKPAIFVQEIRALGLGQLAAEPHLEDFLLVDSGDGVGAATIVGGHLQSGHIPLSGELGHTPVLNNDRRCGSGAIGCVETLISREGLLKSFADHGGQPTWNALLSHVKHQGLPQWLKASLDAVATTIAGALNVEGIPNVLLSGSLAEFPEIVSEYLAAQIRRGAMWSRLGTVSCRTTPRRRMAGLISAGIDRLLLVSDP